MPGSSLIQNSGHKRGLQHQEASSEVVHGRLCVHCDVCVHTEWTPGLALGPEPSLAREDPQTLCPPSHSSGPALLALPKGALGGSALRPTGALTQDNHGGGGWVEVWTGHHKPEQQLPTEGALGDRPAQGRKGSFLVAWEGTEGCREPKARLPQAWWDTGCGY